MQPEPTPRTGYTTPCLGNAHSHPVHAPVTMSRKQLYILQVIFAMGGTGSYTSAGHRAAK
jgi:hypothetical protein